MPKTRPQRRIDRNVAQVARTITIIGGGEGGGTTTAHTHSQYATDDEVIQQVASAIATHSANEDAHHDRLHDIFGPEDHEIEADAYTLIGATLTDTLGKLYISSSGDGIDVTKSGGNFTIAVDVSDFVGDGLRDDGSNNVAIKPSDFAGNGLTSSSYDLHVGAGDGITVGTNAVSVNEAFDFDWTGDHTHTGSIASSPFDSADPITGWKIEADGDAWFANIEATSLTIKTFVADVTLALAGSDIITKSRAIVSRDFTTPSVSGTLYVHDLPGQPNTAVFESGDFVRLRHVQRSTGLVVGDVWGTVSSYTDLADTEQSWTFTRTSGSTGQTIYAGMVAIDYGTSGDGVIELSSLGSDTPYISLRTWTTTPANSGNFTTVARLGNLSGITDADYGALSGYGLYTDDIKARGSIGAAGGDVWIADEGINIQAGTGGSGAWSNYSDKITFSTDPLAAQSAAKVVGQIGARQYDTGAEVLNNMEFRVDSGTTWQTDEAIINILAQHYTSNSAYTQITMDSSEAAATIEISAVNSLGGAAYINLNASNTYVQGNILMSGGGNIGTALAPVGTLYADELVVGTTYTENTGYVNDTRYYPRSELDTLLTGYSVTGHSHAGLVTSATLSSTLASYATTAALSAAIADFLVEDDVTTLLSDYVTSVSLTGTLSTYALQSWVISQLTSYVTSAGLTSTLGSYVTSAALTTTLDDYVTSSSLTTTLNDYVTSSGLTTTLDDFYSKAQTDALLGGYSLTSHSHTSLPLTEITYGGSATINIASDGTLTSSNYVSGRTGYSIGPNGLEASNADIRGVIRSGLLQSQGTLWTYGTQLFGPSAKVRSELTITAPGTQVTVAVDDADAGHVQVFSVGDVLKVAGPAYIVPATSSDNSTVEPWLTFVMPTAVLSSSEVMAEVWLEVDSVSDETTHWEYTCTVRYGPRSVFSPGAIVGSYGTSTTGRISITSDALYAPYMDIFTTGDTPWAGVTSHLRIGRLDGLAVGSSDRTAPEYGMAAAVDLSDADSSWLITSNRRIKGNNLDLSFTDGDSTLLIDASDGFYFSDPMTESVWALDKNMATLIWHDETNDETAFYIGPASTYEEDTTFNPLDIIAYHHKYTDASGNIFYAARVRAEASPITETNSYSPAYLWLDSQAWTYVDDEQGGGGFSSAQLSADTILLAANDGQFSGEWTLPGVLLMSESTPRSTLDLPIGRVYVDASGYFRVVV